MMAAEKGDLFFLTLGPALAGMVIHMMTGAAFGALFALLMAKVDLSPSTAVAAGLGYGLVGMLVTSFLALPLAASIFGGGEPISGMASMVGWPTFTIEHLIYGMVLGLWAAMALRKTGLATRTSYSGGVAAR